MTLKIDRSAMTQPTIYCGTYKRIEDGSVLEGPLVEYSAHRRTEATVRELSSILAISEQLRVSAEDKVFALEQRIRDMQAQLDARRNA